MGVKKLLGRAVTTMKPNEHADTVKYATFRAFTRSFRQHHMQLTHRMQVFANSGTFAPPRFEETRA